MRRGNILLSDEKDQTYDYTKEQCAGSVSNCILGVYALETMMNDTADYDQRRSTSCQLRP